jgi:DNA polymerase elongation subunit (family B)
MGTATIWKLVMLAWSYKNGLAIPAKKEKRNFVGGLSRLLKVGYSKNVLKLDYSSLYPSIQLVHDVFPECDITGSMKGFLTYFRNSRIMYKNLSAEYKTIDKKKSTSYDRKQLPIKIFINAFFGSLSAPHVFPWGDIDKGEQITCTGRQYLRQMLKFFSKKGYSPLVCDTDGMNFSLPDGGVDDRTYVGKGLNWLVKEGKEYSGYDADVAEFNDLFMKGEMGLDCDGTWDSCINLARKNYATMEHNGKVKLTGNSIKSKKMPKYIEKFLDKGVKQLLRGEGKEFIDWYYEYIQKIFDLRVPLAEIASKARVKISVEDYIKRSKQTTKSGSLMSRQAHMELIIRDGIQSNLGDVILYVNNGNKASHGDVQKINEKMPKKEVDLFFEEHGSKPILGSHIQLNCYRIEPSDLENNPEMLGEYNIQRAIATFNKRVEPLLIVFDDEVRDTLLVKNPEDRSFYTSGQCKLINGKPFSPEDQDDIYENLIKMEQGEIDFWDSVGVDPNYIYELAETGWEEHIN